MSTAVIPSLWQLQNRAKIQIMTEQSPWIYSAGKETAFHRMWKNWQKEKMKILGEREEDENEEEEIQITE